MRVDSPSVMPVFGMNFTSSFRRSRVCRNRLVNYLATVYLHATSDRMVNILYMDLREENGD